MGIERPRSGVQNVRCDDYPHRLAFFLRKPGDAGRLGAVRKHTEHAVVGLVAGRHRRGRGGGISGLAVGRVSLDDRRELRAVKAGRPEIVVRHPGGSGSKSHSVTDYQDNVLYLFILRSLYPGPGRSGDQHRQQNK